MSRNTCIVYQEWGKMIGALPDEEAGKLTKMILAYAFESEEPKPSESALLDAVFAMMKDKLDSDAQKYEDKKERAQAARKKKQQTEPEPTEEGADSDISLKSDRNQSDINLKSDRNQSENNSVHEHVHVHGHVPPTGDIKNPPSPLAGGVRRNTKAERAAAELEKQLPEWNFSPGVSEALKDWIAYKAERGHEYKPMGLKKLLREIDTDVREKGESWLIRAVNHSIAQGWQGIHPREESTRAAPFDPAEYAARLAAGGGG